MAGEGMVAVVQSLRDAGLAVTLLDGSRNTYSLVPNHVQAPQAPQPPYQTIRLQRQNSAAGTDSTHRCDSSAQATDGRYASVYQTTHGNLSPTSRPVQVTEFPPQRAELCPGHGNFEVGGLGSGETGRCAIRPQQGQFRGGLSWVDRGAVCSPRPSQHIDAFASSLRKYPALSPASSEMVERLITYSHAKNLTRHQSKGTSPVRSPTESEVSHNTYTRRGGHGDSRARSRVDEYPTREGRPRREDFDRRTYNRNYDVRFVRDMSRAKDFAKTCNCNYYNGMTEGLDSPSFLQRKFPDNMGTNSVHTETQAVVKMVSKEVATVPKSEPVKKNVAVPHGSSTSVGNTEGAVSDLPNPSQVDQIPSKIVSFKSVQTTFSSVELVSTQKQTEARRSKSEDDLRRKHFQEGIIELIGNIAVNSKTKDEQLKEKILKDMWVKLHKVLENVEQQNDRDKALINISKKMRNRPILIPARYEKESRKKIRKWADIDVYRVALPPFKISNIEGLEDIVKDWVNCLPIQSHDFVGRPINKLHICDTLVRKLLKLFTCNAKFDYETLKLQILNIIGLAPIDIIGKRKRSIIDSAVNALVCKLRNVAPNMFKSVITSELRNKYDKFNKRISTIESNIEECVLNDVLDFTEKHNLELNGIDLNEITTELTNMIFDFIYDPGVVTENVFKEDIISFLKEYNIEIDKGMELANVILKNIKQKTSPPAKYGIRDFIVCLNTATKRQKRSTAFYNASANSDAYRDDLCQQIDEWLTELPIEIHKLKDKDTRDAVVNDLAAEIVDRKKYLEFNCSKTTDEKELEYLKYQIYKWIDKLVEDKNIDIMEHASYLMERIRDIPVPKLTLFNANILHVEVQKTTKPTESNTATENISVKDNNDINNPSNSKRRPSILKTKNHNGNGTKCPVSSSSGSKTQQHFTVEQLNNDYDEYVKKWVKQIPIPSTSPEEQELVVKLRVGIYNGVWKALTKLKFDPGTYNNSFYYQDMLDNELEDLFNCLPNSAELEAKKHLLKAQLLEQTTNTHEKIKKLLEPTLFKQALIENVVNSIPKIASDDQDDPIKKFEDLQILGIVEDFIVISNYEEDNQVIANTFKKKLIKKAEAFVEELKKNHGKELKDIDMNTYTQDIIDALSSVPAPSDDSLKEEAEEIMLGIEVEHWFNDLPLVPNDDYDEQLQRRRIRDKLTKKIADLQKSNMEECAAETAVKGEITKFFAKVPLLSSEDQTINFMAEELLNRITNKKRERGNTRRRSVVFQDDIKYPSYNEFSKEMPHCSSLSCNQSNQSNISSIHPSAPGEADFYQTYNPNLNDSTFIGGGMSNNVVPTNASIYGGRGYNTFEDYRPVSSSIHHSHIPPDMNDNVALSQPLKSKWSTFEGTSPSQGPNNIPVTSYSQQVPGPDATWYSLEEVEIPPEMRAQFQSQVPNLQSLKSMTYVDSQDQFNRSGPQAAQRSCCVENKDTSQIAQVIQDQISMINQVATGHTVDTSQLRDISQVGNDNQHPDGTHANAKQALQTNEVFNQNMNRFNEIPTMTQTSRLLNQSDIPRTNVGITQTNRGNFSLEATPTQAPLVQTQQNVFNRSIEISRTPRSGQYSPQQVPIQNVQRSTPPFIQYSPQQVPFQDIPNIAPEVLQTQQNVFNRSIEISRTPRSAQYSPQQVPIQNVQRSTPPFIQNSPQQVPFQDIPNIAPEVLQNQQNISIHSIPPIPRPTLPPQTILSPQQYLSPQQIPGQIVPEISEPQQISQQIQTQPSGSSYGQPQGFSTPHQEPNQRSPPRIGRKTHDPLRFRSGPARRRLDLDNDDDEGSEEDCPCIARLKRRFNDDMDYPCFYPFGYPYPYFF